MAKKKNEKEKGPKKPVDWPVAVAGLGTLLGGIAALIAAIKS